MPEADSLFSTPSDETAIASDRQPVVFAKGGEVFASSRDVAAAFEKRHDNVIRDIGNLIRAEPSLGLRQFAQGGVLKFEETPYVNEQNGQTYKAYAMTRDGFTLLAMGFTGAKALRWKLRYIEAFNALEAELRRRASTDPAVALNDPTALRGLLLTYSEKVLALEATNAELTPKAQALDRIATAEGALCITAAAKALQVQPKALFTYLRQHGWIYKRPGSAHYLGYQGRTNAGDLEHKVHTILRADGSEKIIEQVLVTPQGLTKLAKLATSNMRIVA